MHVKKRKEMIRTWQVRAPPLFCPSMDRALYGVYEMETYRDKARLAL
jgi:hypothetical protein